MLEWLKRHAWKACGLPKGLASSNLALSAENGFADKLQSRYILVAGPETVPPSPECQSGTKKRDPRNLCGSLYQNKWDRFFGRLLLYLDRNLTGLAVLVGHGKSGCSGLDTFHGDGGLIHGGGSDSLISNFHGVWSGA